MGKFEEEDALQDVAGFVFQTPVRPKKSRWPPSQPTAMQMAAALGAIASESVANTALPAVSALCLADGAVGFYYHARGIARRPGGMKKPLYNALYGPPVFAPLLFAACGFLGLLASVLRREKQA